MSATREMRFSKGFDLVFSALYHLPAASHSPSTPGKKVVQHCSTELQREASSELVGKSVGSEGHKCINIIGIKSMTGIL